ncbi:MAG: choice-of-anchor Q domain-containing protein [Chloroflexota bacterium]
MFKRLLNLLTTHPELAFMGILIAILVLLPHIPYVNWYGFDRFPVSTSGGTPIPSSSETLVVTTESGPGSFQDILAKAPNGATITFAPELKDKTVNFGFTATIDKSLTIVGPINLSSPTSNGASNLFSMVKGVTIELNNVDIVKSVGDELYRGGVIVNNGGTLRLINSRAFGNATNVLRQAPSGAGVINNIGGTVVIEHCSFDNNKAGSNQNDSRFDRAMGGSGAVLYNDHGNMTISDSSFHQNTAHGDGGVIYNDHGTITITHTEFDSNVANNQVSVQNNQASNSFLVGRGGAIFSDGGEVTITRSTFDYNTAVYLGGAIYLTGMGKFTLANTSFVYNTATGGGGAIYNEGADLTLINATLYFNKGNGLWGGNSIFGTAQISNSILQNDKSVGRNCVGGITDNGHNLQYPDNDCGTSIPVGDVLFAKGSNRGDLQANSPAIDAGDNTVCAAEAVNNVDLLGITRPLDGGTGKAICDIGAFEYDPNAKKP